MDNQDEERKRRKPKKKHSKLAPASSKFPDLPPKSTVKYNNTGEELYCICRKPDYGELMIGCDGCDDWYHFSCVKIDTRYKNLVASYFCPYCELEGKGSTLWKHKCRLPDCYEPIMQSGSKYCSKEHGIQFFRNVVEKQIPSQQYVDGVVCKDQLQKFVHYYKGFNDFAEMGETLPEVAQKEFTADSRIKNIDNSIVELKLQRDFEVNKKKLLIKTKENIKKLNDLLIPENGEGTPSNTRKGKKIEVCGYDMILSEVKQENINESDLISNDLDFLKTKYLESLQDPSSKKDIGFCLNEKRKCTKHNGWQAMINDNLDMNISKIDEKIQILQQNREKVKKVMSIDYYESKLH